MKYALVLDSLQDVQKFTEIVQQIDADVRLLGRDENGSPWELSAKSVFCTVLLGTHLQRRHSHPPKILTGMQSTVNVIMIFII